MLEEVDWILVLEKMSKIDKFLQIKQKCFPKNTNFNGFIQKNSK